MFVSRYWTWILCALLLLIPGRRAAAGVPTIQWDASQDSAVIGYKVFVGTEPGNYSTVVDVGNQLQYAFPDAQAGYTYYFAVAAYRPDGVVGPQSPEVLWSAPSIPAPGPAPSPPPRLANPGDLTSVVGAPATLQLTATAAAAAPLTYAANGLPPGLAIDQATGVIAGTPTSEGTYRVNADVSSGGETARESFIWTIEPRPLPRTPVISVAIPTAALTFSTTQAFVLIGGTALDDHGVAALTWVNNRGGSGKATGTDQWVTLVHLRTGKNDITITAVDGDSNRSQIRLSILFAPPTRTLASRIRSKFEDAKPR